jgi:GNAT superfamily N-acetyltransferase
MSGALLIRDVAPADRSAWLRLWLGYLDFYETSLDPAITDTTWTRFLDPAEPMFCLVAEGDDGALIGFVNCVLHRGTWSIGDFCYLEDLYVSPDARRGGVGRALIEAVYARADELECGRVYWLTHESNPARKLYDEVARHLGFIQYRR